MSRKWLTTCGRGRHGRSRNAGARICGVRGEHVPSHHGADRGAERDHADRKRRRHLQDRQVRERAGSASWAHRPGRSPSSRRPRRIPPTCSRRPSRSRSRPTASTLRRFAAANRICPVLNLSLPAAEPQPAGVDRPSRPGPPDDHRQLAGWRSRQPVLLAFAREGVARNDREEADDRRRGRAASPRRACTWQCRCTSIDLRWEVDADNVSDGLAARDLSDSRLDARSARPSCSARADGALWTRCT